MPALPRELRQVLERTVIEARGAAESAARASLSSLAVDRDKPFDDLSEPDRTLRRALRAKERQLGRYDALVSEIAYQHWHRMLFARFMAENGLLMHPELAVAVSVQEIADLAREEGEADPWVLASRYAAEMLPGIFRQDDPELAVRLAPEGRKQLEGLLSSLPPPVFQSEDGLGWVYQFWQAKARDEVNSSGRRVAGSDIPPVTQFFTDRYMVEFLLQNSLGAWWATRHPTSRLVRQWEYLRTLEDGTPVCGRFDQWPDKAANVTVMDPCCGSGHFLVAAASMLRQMRIEEEGLAASEAAEAVLRDSLFGLELDARCTQLAAFALLLDAWKATMPTSVRVVPNVACSGVKVASQLNDWLRLAQDDARLEGALGQLYDLFKNAPEVGSLINPAAGPVQQHLLLSRYQEVEPLLARALAQSAPDPVAAVLGASAEGAVQAAELLTRKFTLVTTNVPYLGFKKMGPVLKEYVSRFHNDARHDLATAFIDRIGEMLTPSGAYAVVAPEAWSFQGSYTAFRRRFLQSNTIRCVASLGPRAFEAITGEVVSVALIVGEPGRPTESSAIRAFDVSVGRSPAEKETALRSAAPGVVNQLSQLRNPDARVTLTDPGSANLLETYAEGLSGIQTGDYSQFGRCHWELRFPARGWIPQQSTVHHTLLYGGCEHILLWEDGKGRLQEHFRANRDRLPGQPWRGVKAWGKRGVAVSSMGDLPVCLYTGFSFDNNTAVILPRDDADLPAIWSFCSSGELSRLVRMIDKKLKVTNATMVKVPFDINRWREIAARSYPKGLPQPVSEDPTQWYFRGDVRTSRESLQVAVARLAGYRWPKQQADALDDLVDPDGVVSIPAIAGEPPAAQRLRVFLARAWGDAWSSGKLDELLGGSNSSADLETWLRDSFFASHAKLFQNRPFIWHIWDGRKDGFAVLVNYHQLDRQLLDRITHTLLGSWIEVQRDEARKKLPGAEARLVAAQDLQRKLELIAEGEPPYDIYVRWKSLYKQPLGWDPDLNDGVRINIRPFVTAGVLRSKFTIDWKKDRGKDPDGSERVNDRHFTRDQKLAAREKRPR